MRIVALVAVAGLASCFSPSTYDCDTDFECSGGEVCARTHECVAAAEVRAVRVRWNIAGQAGTAAEGCAALGLGDLSIKFSGGDATPLSFAPVPCGGGLYVVDKLPTRYDVVELFGGDANGTAYSASSSIGDAVEYTLTLSPR